LAAEQNGRCCYCGIRFGAEIPEIGWTAHDSRATVEHFVARSFGGSDAWDNLAAACFRCNNKRGNEDALAFFERKGWLSRRQLNRKLWLIERLIREAEPVPREVLKRRRAAKSAYYRGLALAA
jgi:hypothetical protein